VNKEEGAMGWTRFLVSEDKDFCGAKAYDVSEAADAAELFVELNIEADPEYPDTDVYVRDPDGVVTAWTVTLDWDPSFHATEKKVKESA